MRRTTTAPSLRRLYAQILLDEFPGDVQASGIDGLDSGRWHAGPMNAGEGNHRNDHSDEKNRENGPAPFRIGGRVSFGSQEPLRSLQETSWDEHAQIEGEPEREHHARCDSRHQHCSTGRLCVDLLERSGIGLMRVVGLKHDGVVRRRARLSIDTKPIPSWGFSS